MEGIPHIEPGPNPTSKESLRERAIAKENETSAAELNKSRIEETHAMQELVPAHPVYHTTLIGERKCIDIPANKFYKEDALSTEISKLVKRFGHYDQDEGEIYGAVHWD